MPVKEGEASVNVASNAVLSDSVSAILLQRQQRLLIGPTGLSVVIPWLTVQLLAALAERSPHFVDAKALQALVWPDTHISPDALKQRVRLARQALREAGYDPGLLDSVRGEGYALRVPLREPPHAETLIGVPTANVTPSRSGSTSSASWFRRSRIGIGIGIVAALTVTAGLVTVGIWPSLPRLHVGVLVRGVVVEDDMDGEVFRHAAHHLLEKDEELLMAMLREALLLDGPRGDIQRGKQRRRAMALVVMRHRAGASFLHRQAGLGAIKRLKLAFLIERKDDGPLRRMQIQPHDIPQLRDELGIGRQLELLHAMRLEAVRAPDSADRRRMMTRRRRH